MPFPTSATNASDFSGAVPLFPLPSVSLFPNVMLPLHVFEPRYRTMVEDVLRTHRTIAMAVLQEGWEPSYESKKLPLHKMVCLGQIVADERLDDGRYFLLLQGLCRGELAYELETDRPYRVGQIRVCKDIYPTEPVINRDHRQQELVHYFKQIFDDLDLDSSLIAALESGVPLGELCDVIAHAMRPDVESAKRLLEQADVDQRSDLVLELLKLQYRRSRGTLARPFPPSFSLN